jgi:hypothetical protein
VIEIRNLLFQPLTFQLAGEEGGLYLTSRQRKLVDDAQVSEEMRTAATRGFVVITPLEQPDGPEAQSDEIGSADTPSDNATQFSGEPAADESAQAPDESTSAIEEGVTDAGMQVAEQSEETASDATSRKRR